MNFWMFLDRNGEGVFWFLLIVIGILGLTVGGIAYQGCSCGPGFQIQIGPHLEERDAGAKD